MLESQVQKKIINHLSSDGWFVTKIIQTSTNGFPDIHALRGGIPLYIEAKRPGRTSDPLQVYRIKQLNDAGGKAFCCDSFDEFLTIYNQLHVL